MAKLSAEKIKRIRELRSLMIPNKKCNGMKHRFTIKQLGEMFGRSTPVIGEIVSGHLYKWVQ